MLNSPDMLNEEDDVEETAVLARMRGIIRHPAMVLQFSLILPEVWILTFRAGERTGDREKELTEPAL